MGLAESINENLSKTSPAFVAELSSLVRLELAEQKKQLFLWAPVFVALGVGVYFSLPFEPPLIAGLGIFGFTAALMALFRKRAFTVCVLLSLVAVGFLSGQMRTHLIHTPILQKELSPVNVTGTIEAIENMGEGAGSRITLSALEIERLAPEKTPVKIRLRLRKDPGLMVGQRISTLAGLNAPSAPVIPGGFDFQRYLYFQQIGAVGFIYKNIEVVDDAAVRQFPRLVEKLRTAIAQRTEAHMHYPQAGVAMALTTGRKTAITDADKEAMRNAGLAHILAISGLHVGLFSGVMFFFSRLFMVAIPGFALRYPVKKYAAVIGIMAAFAYMLLAGATVPTQRAFVMTSLVFVAILFDRSPVSLRLVAFAALLVLLIFPESLLSASFHMSFGAVVALIVFYDRIRTRWSGWHSRAGIMRRIALYVTGVCMTTLIASIATAPFALFHFQQMALYSLLGNVLVMPLMAFVIMPGIVAALFLMPFHLEFIGLFVLDYGLKGVLGVAHWVSSLPNAAFLQPLWPLSSLLFIVFGALILFLFKTRLRWISCGFLCVSLSYILIYKQPDILFSSNFKLIAIKAEDGAFLVSNRRSERFARENWVRSFGLEDGAEKKWPREQAEFAGTPFTCDELACRYRLKGYDISYLKDLTAQDSECAHADIVLSSQPMGKECGASYVIDLWDAYNGGAHAIWLGRDSGPRQKKDASVRIKASESLRGHRPWSSLNESF